jgi:hypothetical protein
MKMKTMMITIIEKAKPFWRVGAAVDRTVRTGQLPPPPPNHAPQKKKVANK